jgi:hypothetical protein
MFPFVLLYLQVFSVSSVKRLRRRWGLLSTRQQKHNFETIANYIQEIRKRFPFRGAENIRKMLRQNHGMHVPRYANNDVFP